MSLEIPFPNYARAERSLRQARQIRQTQLKLMEFLPTAVPPPPIEISFPNLGKKAVSRETLSHAAQKAKPTLQAACRRT
ncbi:hypothetical protein RLEG3_03205 (plasmid) [Rhizobium leguminosarum bv. trifolii WSM1689]|nr:hypothetical protein RLEG3_03205 [Rhizobium leguminosarum bv. trifolii WSM1689]